MFRYAHGGLRTSTQTMRALGDAHRQRRTAREAAASANRSSSSRTSGSASRDGRVRGRCSSSDASRARCGTSTRAAATAFCTTCWSSPAAPTCSPTSSASRSRLSTEMILARAPEVIIELHVRTTRSRAAATRRRTPRLERAAIGSGGQQQPRLSAGRRRVRRARPPHRPWPPSASRGAHSPGGRFQ